MSQNFQARSYELIKERGMVLVRCGGCGATTGVPVIAGSFNCNACGQAIVIEKVVEKPGLLDWLFHRGRSLVRFGKR